MAFYTIFFFHLYEFFNAIKSDFVSSELVAFKVVVTISILPILNLAVLPIDLRLGHLLLIFTILVVCNSLYFVLGKRYTVFLGKFRKTSPSDLSIVLTVMYVIGSIVVYLIL